MFKKLLLGSIFSLFCFSVQSRVPENLAGTDLFTDITLPPATDAKEATSVSSLPLSNLNLCYGAELFASGAIQALYKNGDVIRVVKTEAADKKDIFTIHFYKEVVTKTPLTYADVNPLAMLVRILFFQTPGTSSMANFKVAEPCCEKIEVGGKKVIGDDKTTDNWAFTIAHTIQILSGTGKAQTIPSGLPQMMQHAGRERFNFTKPQGFSFDRLIKDCAAYAEAHGFGKWFVARIFIGAVYERYGSNQAMIFKFYSKLLEYLRTMYGDIPNLAQISIPSSLPDSLPTQFTKTQQGSGKAFQAFKLITLLQGIFEPLTYKSVELSRGITFPDCFETLVRNIVIKLILKQDGSFDHDKLSPRAAKFFKEFNDPVKQSTSAAHNSWASLLIDEIPGAFYKYNEGGVKYELRNSLNNFLVVINHIFGLGITTLDAYKNSSETEGMHGGMLAAVNAGLKAKFGLATDESDESNNIIEIAQIDKVSDTLGNTIKGVIRSPSGKLLFYMHVQLHGDLSKEADEKQITIFSEQLSSFPYLVGTLQSTQPGLTAHHLMGVLNKPMTESLLTIMLPLLLNQPNSCISRMVYAAVAQNYDIDQTVYLSLLSILVENGLAFPEATATATAAVVNVDPGVRRVGVQHFQLLFNQKQNFPEAFEVAFSEAAKAAVAAAASADRGIRITGLELFQILVSQGTLVNKEQVFNEVAKAAVAAAAEASAVEVTHANKDIHIAGLELFKRLVNQDTLVDKKQAFSEAAKAAAAAVTHVVGDIRIAGLELFQVLFIKEQGFSEAVKAAAAAVKNTNSGSTVFMDIRNTGLKLFQVLFDNTKYIPEAAKAVVVAETATAAAATSADFTIHNVGLELFQALLAKTLQFPEASNAAVVAAATVAAAAVKNTNRDIRDRGLQFFNVLLAKTLQFPEGFKAAVVAAATAAADVVKSSETFFHRAIRNIGLELFQVLFDKTQNVPEAFEVAFSEAATAAAAAATSADFNMHFTGLELFKILVNEKALVNKEQVFNEAAKAAAAAVTSIKPGKNAPTNLFGKSLPDAGLQLFQTLHAKKQGHDAAARLLGIKESERNWVVKEVIELYKLKDNSVP